MVYEETVIRKFMYDTREFREGFVVLEMDNLIHFKIVKGIIITD